MSRKCEQPRHDEQPKTVDDLNNNPDNVVTGSATTTQQQQPHDNTSTNNDHDHDRFKNEERRREIGNILSTFFHGLKTSVKKDARTHLQRTNTTKPATANTRDNIFWMCSKTDTKSQILYTSTTKTHRNEHEHEDK